MDNINSQLIDTLKKALVDNGCYLFYIKNSLARKALDMRENDWNDQESPVYSLYQEIGRKDIKGLDKLKDNFREINGCIFANGNLSKVAELIDSHTLASNG